MLRRLTAMTTTKADYLIVGGGVFGASTALHLSKAKPSALIVLVDRTDFPCPIGASHDINKAVRADYEDLFYCRLGLKTLERWRNDDLFKKYYHQSGMITIENGDHSMGQQIISNFKKLDVHYEAEVFSPKEMRTRFGGLFAKTDYSHVDEIYWNPLSGWAEAARALEGTIKAAVDHGVKYMSGSVSKLLLREDVCTGVQLENTQQIDAKRVILSTGAYTAKLIADSAPDRSHLQVGRRITATAVCEATTDMNDAQKEKFKDMPVFVLDDQVTQGSIYPRFGVSNLTGSGETMPITSNDQMKWIRDVSWKNTVDHTTSGQKFSVPLTTAAGSQWSAPEDIPLGLRQEIETVIKGMYGDDSKDLMPNTMRMCWYVSLVIKTILPLYAGKR